jgi:hypothetical protein
VIPPRMLWQAPGRGSHLPVNDPRPMRSPISASFVGITNSPPSSICLTEPTTSRLARYGDM